MKWYETLLINPFLQIILLVILVVIGIFIVKKVLITDEQWRRLDLYWLIFTTLGIFCILGNNREFFYKREANIRNNKINAFERRVKFELNPDIYNRTFNATMDDIELFSEDFETMYSWLLVNKDSILECIKEKQYIDSLSFKLPVFKLGNQTFLPQNVEELKYIISEYNNVLNEYNYYMVGANKNLIEIIYEIFTPIFCVISLSYQFVRWFWEGTRNVG